MSVPGTNVHPNFAIFQSGDQSPNLNQWEISAWYSNPSPSLSPNPSPATEISHFTLIIPMTFT